MGEVLALGVVAGLIAFVFAHGIAPHSAGRAASRPMTEFVTSTAVYDLRFASGQLSARSRDGLVVRDVDLAIVVDGTVTPLSFARDDMKRSDGELRASVRVVQGGSELATTLAMRVDASNAAISLALENTSETVSPDHTIALRVEIPSEGQIVFASGLGSIADRATVTSPSLVVGMEPHPLGVTSPTGPITIDVALDDLSPQGEPKRVSVTSAAGRSSASGRICALDVVLAASSMTVWRSIADLLGQRTGTVSGRVTGTNAPATVVGLDTQGSPQVRAAVSRQGTFSLEVPETVVGWYAAIDPGRASSIASFTPGTPGELTLDVGPGGDLHVAIVDADTRSPLTARLLVRGMDGSVDPNFGPDYRASGAGPVIDALRGDILTPLPMGRYRVAATKGIEWSIDAKVVDIVAGRLTDIELAPRHVVPTPGVYGCDLHVHARPSFDTPVTMEDRVVSLVAAGIDFAVPTEHNLVGDYTPALETLDLKGEFASVPGVEVTTYSKGFGHFGVFPFTPGDPVPPFKHTTINAVFRAVRTGDPSRYFQLNHPRLPKGIGYFNIIAFDPHAQRAQIHGRVDFDGIEVYNGYDSERPDRVDQVLRDYWALLNFGWRPTATGSSDSHRIQFHWAGYPRTMVAVPGGPDDAPPDPAALVANVKNGHATVTVGPVIEFDIDGVPPGGEVLSRADPLRGHLRVRAAPWIDVTDVEVVVGGRVAQTFDVTSRPTELGPEPGTLGEAQARTIRFDAAVDVSVGPDNGWVMVIARGRRRMDDVLPFMPVLPFAFTNPVYITRHPEPTPPFPGASRASAQPGPHAPEAP
ncbi:MAG: CehA/McbA family metallohydrolase [Polyangiaceae bacterium]